MEVDAHAIIHFPAGLPGFPGSQDYVIFDHDQDVPFKWLQAIDEPDLAFVIVDPSLCIADYQVDIRAQDVSDLHVDDRQHLSLFVLVTIRRGQAPRITANLQGPIVVNTKNRWAKQLILHASPYHTRHLLFEASQAST